MVVVAAVVVVAVVAVVTNSTWHHETPNPAFERGFFLLSVNSKN
jgi:hypothetical protein